MSTHRVVFAFTAILVASMLLTPAFAQIVEPIVVTTDKKSYSDGDTVAVTGQVKDYISGQPVSLKVIAANGNLVTIKQLDVNTDKTFSTNLTAGGALWKSAGTYTIDVLYGTQQRVAQTTFEFGGSSGTTGGSSGPTMAVSGTDFKVGYTITGGKLLSITPDVESNSLVIAIDATSDGSLTITLPRALIDAKIGSDDDAFFVLVDGEEVDFDESKTDTDRTLTIQFPAGAEEIEIIGTKVVPEFGSIAALILVVAIVSVIAVSARSRLSLMPKF